MTTRAFEFPNVNKIHALSEEIKQTSRQCSVNLSPSKCWSLSLFLDAHASVVSQIKPPTQACHSNDMFPL